MPRRFSPQFERDYEFYFRNKDRFNFSGGDAKHRVQFPGESEPTYLNDKGEEETVPFEIPYSEVGQSAKRCFHDLDSRGKCKPCSEPQLLVELLNCKASVNFHIKLWAEGRAEYSTSLEELQEMMEFFQAPEWVLKAVEKQKVKLLKERSQTIRIDKHLATLHLGELLQELGKEIK